MEVSSVSFNATSRHLNYFAGIVWGTLRARISTPVASGTVTVLAVRPEEQRGLEPSPVVNLGNFVPRFP
jgi:hypothetical protein